MYFLSLFYHIVLQCILGLYATICTYKIRFLYDFCKNVKLGAICWEKNDILSITARLTFKFKDILHI